MGRSLPHGQDMGKKRDHRISIEQWLAVGGWWRLVVGGWHLVAVCIGWLLAAVGGRQQTCHKRLAGKLILSRNRPRITGHSVIPVPCTTGTQ